MKIIIFILLILSPSLVSSEEFIVNIHWTHSGRGMDKFVFQYSPSDTGAWSQIYPVMIADLNPIEKDDTKQWSTTIIVNAESHDEILWWRVYAETSYDLKSEISQPSKSVRVLMKPYNFKVYI